MNLLPTVFHLLSFEIECIRPYFHSASRNKSRPGNSWSGRRAETAVRYLGQYGECRLSNGQLRSNGQNTSTKIASRIRERKSRHEGRNQSTLFHLQVTEDTAKVLMSIGYTCVCRGPTYVKGKGTLITYFVRTPFDDK